MGEENVDAEGELDVRRADISYILQLLHFLLVTTIRA